MSLIYKKLEKKIRGLVVMPGTYWSTLRLGVNKFSSINGSQWAGSFAFDAFFSLFPMLILLVSVVSFFIDRNSAGEDVIGYIKQYVPITGNMKRYIFSTIDGVIKAREGVSVIAFLVLLWSSLQCFLTLIMASTHAWGHSFYSWPRRLLESLMFLGISAGAAVVGIGLPFLIQLSMDWFFPAYELRSWVYSVGMVLFPLLTVFMTLTLFYRLMPKQKTRFADVWTSALFVTGLLWAGQKLFIIYLTNFATLNAVYGAFGGIMALLLWIYLSGSFFIFGVCLCAIHTESQSGTIHSPTKQ